MKIVEFLTSLKKRLQITKRQRFLLIAVVLAFLLFTMQVTAMQINVQFIVFLAAMTALLSVWGLKEDLSGVEWFTLFILPVSYSIAVGLSYYLLPASWNMRVFVAGIFAVGMYALLLTENIYNIAAIRTIELLRAAHAIGFLLTLLTLFLLFNTVFSFHLGVMHNTVIVFVLTFFLVLQNLWSIELEEVISSKVFLYTLIISLILAETALALSFWPAVTTVKAIFLVAVCYVMLGIAQQIFTKRPTSRVLVEYIIYGIIVLIGMILVTHWGG